MALIWILNLLHYNSRLMSLFLQKYPRWCHASHTHAVIQSAVDCSLHPAALSLVAHPIWVSVRGTKRASSPIRSIPACCRPSPGRSASARWCWSGAWPSPTEAKCPTAAGQPWLQWDEARRSNGGEGTTAMLFMYATEACKSNKAPKQMHKMQFWNGSTAWCTSFHCSQACLGGCAGYLCNSSHKQQNNGNEDPLAWRL